ncbi:hypothetical protein C8Q79DRAFT_309234 [Trametes meyenii]|nr:hypothetical protein C8Q79DRAFT_309234 [Trametes meyenii]
MAVIMIIGPICLRQAQALLPPLRPHAVRALPPAVRSLAARPADQFPDVPRARRNRAPPEEHIARGLRILFVTLAWLCDSFCPLAAHLPSWDSRCSTSRSGSCPRRPRMLRHTPSLDWICVNPIRC